jgi:hypothetical protein
LVLFSSQPEHIEVRPPWVRIPKSSIRTCRLANAVRAAGKNRRQA